MSDLILQCSGGSPAITIQLNLNTEIGNPEEARLTIDGHIGAFNARPGATANSITWPDLPFDAPVNAGTRTIHLTNIRANASKLALGAVAGYVEIRAPDSINVDNPQQTLAVIKQGLLVGGLNSALRQCVPSRADSPVTNLILREAFAASFGGNSLLVRFNNAGPALNIIVPPLVLLTRGETGNWSGGYLKLFSAPGAGNHWTAQYEVVNADTSVIETAAISIGVEYSGIPPPSQVTAAVSFGPRFSDRASALDVFHIEVCTCTLLFPVVTHAPGFDTTLAILNTTLDPFGTPAQAGRVKMWFYGDHVPSNPALQTTAPAVNPGQMMIWNAAIPEFSGFVIAQTEFQRCEGFAYIWDTTTLTRLDRYAATHVNSLPVH